MKRSSMKYLLHLFIVIPILTATIFTLSQCDPYYTAQQDSEKNYASSIVVYDPNGTVIYSNTDVSYYYSNGDLHVGWHVFQDEYYTWSIE